MRSLLTSSANADRFTAAEDWLHVMVEQYGRILVVAQTQRAADDFVRLACPAQAGLLGIFRTTLSHLAADLCALGMAKAGLARLGGFGVQALAARATQIIKQTDGLSYYSPISQTPGFPSAVAQTMHELRQAGVSAQAVAEFRAASTVDQEALLDLERLLSAYEEELRTQQLADQTMIFQFAIDAAEKARSHRLLGGPLLLLDLAPRTSIEGRFLDRLIQAAPEVLATLCIRDQEGTTRLQKALQCDATDLDDRPKDEGTEPHLTSLDRARRFVFSVQTAEPRDCDETLEFFSAPGEARECIEIARRIRRLAGEEGCAFDRVGVLLRSPQSYQPLLQDALRRAQIPSYFTRGAKRPDPAGRALLSLLACAAEGLSSARFAEYLSLGQVPDLGEDGGPPTHRMAWVPPASETQLVFASAEDESSPVVATPQSAVRAGSLQVPKNWETLLVDAAVIGGRARWERRLMGLEQELRLHLDELDPDEDAHSDKRLELQSLKNLQNFALPIVDFLDRLPRAAHWSAWLESLHTLCTIALRDPDPVLALLAELLPMGEVGPVTLEEVREVLTPQLSFVREEPEGARFGRVFVGTVDEVAGRQFDVVFLPGLAEGIFPGRSFEDPLLLDAHRQNLSEDLPLRSKRLVQERLLLSLALGAATQKLVASYPRMDVARGRPRVPSFYALDLLRAAEGALPALQTLEKRAAAASDARLGWPAPHDPQFAIDDAEYDLAVLGPLIFDAPEAVRGQGRYLIEDAQGRARNTHLVRALRARAARWRAPWSPADGLVDPDPRALEALQSQRLDQRSFSPTALQTYAACPYKFLLYALHRLRPLEQISALEELDPLTRGSLFHSVQFHYFERLQAEGLLPLTKATQDEGLKLLDETMDKVCSQAKEHLAPAIPEVWRREIETMRGDLRRWVRQVAAEDGEWVPVHAEYAFGLNLRDDGRDPASREAPVKVLGRYLIRGSIDLIEKHSKTGALRMTDHKSGRAPKSRPGAVGGGEHLQPMLYALVGAQAFETTVDSGRLYYCTQRGGYDDITIPLNEDTQEKADRVLRTVDVAVATGFFPAAPREGACGRCDFRIVCGPNEETRVRKKRQDRLTELIQLRKTP